LSRAIGIACDDSGAYDFGNLFGLIGGLVVMLTLGFTVVTYFNEVVSAGTYVMLLQASSSLVLFIIAGVGCMGLRAQWRIAVGILLPQRLLLALF
jgi:hypothetical protein